MLLWRPVGLVCTCSECLNFSSSHVAYVCLCVHMCGIPLCLCSVCVHICDIPVCICGVCVPVHAHMWYILLACVVYACTYVVYLYVCVAHVCLYVVYLCACVVYVCPCVQICGVPVCAHVWCTCVHMWCMCVHMWGVHVCMCKDRRWCQVPSSLSTSFWDGFSLNPELIDSQGWAETPVASLPCSTVTDVCDHIWLFHEHWASEHRSSAGVAGTLQTEPSSQLPFALFHSWSYGTKPMPHNGVRETQVEAATVIFKK